MSLETVQRVTESEQQAQREKAEAAEQARHIVAEAERAGEARLTAARTEAENRAKELLAQAEQRAAQQTETVLADVRRECDGLRRDAEGRLETAAKLIIGKVVGI